MKVSDIVRVLPTGSGSVYHGDPNHPFRGFRVRRPQAELPGHFAALVDDSWGPRMSKLVKRRGLTADQRIAQVLDQGYTGILCSTEMASHPALKDVPVLHANDSRQLAESIVMAINRTRARNRITAITGSFGKTSTKAMLVHALRSGVGGSRVFSPPHNQNLSPDVLSHLSRTVDFRHSVVEVAGGAMSQLVSRGVTISPDVAILTGISEAHLSYLKNTRGVAEMKSKIFLKPRPGATAIINRDAEHSDLLMNRAVQAGCQLVSYGESAHATIRLLDYDADTGLTTTEIGSEVVTYQIGAQGRHMALNSLAVLAALRTYRLPRWRASIESLSSFQALPGRGATSEIQVRPGVHVTLIDDAYNANPASIRSSLKHLMETPAELNSRRIAVLGDMQELGKGSKALHAGLAPDVLAAKPNTIYFIGEDMKELHERVAPSVNSMHFDDANNLAELLRNELSTGDVLLIKSAQSTGLHRLVAALKSTRS